MKRRKKSDETRKALLDAALNIIAHKGYTAATVDEIVKEAGVSKGLAYYHFKNKAAIAEAILDNGVEDLIGRFQAAARDSNSAVDALGKMFNSFIDLVVDNRAFGRFFMSELWRNGRVWSDDMRDNERKLIQVIAEQFERAKREGSVPANTDPTFSAVSCIGLVLSASMCYFGEQSIVEDSLDKDEFRTRVRDFAAHGSSIAAKGLEGPKAA